MSLNDAEQRCMICRAIGYVIAAVIVGLIAWWLFDLVPAWLAIIAFLGLFALGLWIVQKFCGDPGTGAVASGAAASAVAGSAVASDATQAEAAKAKAEADAEVAQAKAEADAEAAAAKAEADAEAAAAKAEADAEAAAARAEADAEAARAKAEADAEAARAAAEAEAAAQAAATAADASAANTPDYDGDGVHEGINEGTRPAALDGPRGGKADNLKEIKGVGPKMEKMCNALGFYHFDQIAAWTFDEVAWVDANLEGFKGRVTRDEWVAQAKILAAGGETEFSKRVDEGDVY